MSEFGQSAVLKGAANSNLSSDVLSSCQAALPLCSSERRGDRWRQYGNPGDIHNAFFSSIGVKNMSSGIGDRLRQAKNFSRSIRVCLNWIEEVQHGKRKRNM
jgi:hypothetical protein